MALTDTAIKQAKPGDIDRKLADENGLYSKPARRSLVTDRRVAIGMIEKSRLSEFTGKC